MIGSGSDAVVRLDLGLAVVAVAPRGYLNIGLMFGVLSRLGTPSGVPVGGFFILESDRRTLLRPRRLRGVELPVTLFDAASPLVPGNRGTDMVQASALACSGDFLLRLAGCQSEDLIAQVRRAASAASWYCGRSAPAPALSGGSGRLCHAPHRDARQRDLPKGRMRP